MLVYSIDNWAYDIVKKMLSRHRDRLVRLT